MDDSGHMHHGDHSGHNTHHMDTNITTHSLYATEAAAVASMDDNLIHHHHDHDHAHTPEHNVMNHMMHHMMSMSFHGGYNETILFDQWTISSCSGLIISMIFIFLAAAAYEGLKYYREHLFWKTYNSLQYRAVSVPEKNNATEESARVVHMVGDVIHKQPPTMFSLMHAYQTLLHIIQVTVSFMLMLIFMTYNTWLCIAVVLGAAAGFFLFGWKKSVVVDVTEHCH